MTYEELEYCVNLEKDISNHRFRVERLKELKARVKRVAENEETIEIRICEGYALTPIASVRVREFEDFLDEQIDDENIIIKGLERELFSFVPKKAGEQ